MFEQEDANLEPASSLPDSRFVTSFSGTSKKSKATAPTGIIEGVCVFADGYIPAGSWEPDVTGGNQAISS